MKKMRKILAAVLSAATVFSMSVMPAFAEDPSGENGGDGTVIDGGGTTAETEDSGSGSSGISGLTITKEFKSENGGSLPNATFTFTMKPATVTTDEDGNSTETYNSIQVVPGLPLSDDEVNIDFTATVDSDETGTETFDFTLADGKSFEGPKAYAYVVKEEVAEDDKDSAITYDTEEYTVYLLVDNTNTVTAVVSVSVNEDGEKEATALSKKPIKFTNTCSTDSLVVKKVVTGSMGSKTEQFKFQIVIPETSRLQGGHKIDAGTTYEAVVTRKATGTTEDPISIVVKDETDLTDSDNIVYLADGDFVTISGLPENTDYAIKELEATDYTTTIVGETTDANGDGVKKNVSGKVYDASEKNTPIIDGGNTVTFTNSKDFTPTGLAIKVGQQLLVLLIAVGGALVIFKSRKRKAEK
jgi:pilin isopeptide linkage protein